VLTPLVRGTGLELARLCACHSVLSEHPLPASPQQALSFPVCTDHSSSTRSSFLPGFAHRQRTSDMIKGSSSCQCSRSHPATQQILHKMDKGRRTSLKHWASSNHSPESRGCNLFYLVPEPDLTVPQPVSSPVMPHRTQAE
jgi:hypothetical protein